MSFSALMSKKIIEVPAMYVDAANDSLKWLIVLMVAFVYNTKFAVTYGEGGISSSSAIDQSMRTAGLMALGLFIYHFVAMKLLVFMPASGERMYYFALKRQ
jgi:heptaprenylglyceryl phosphate synthase